MPGIGTLANVGMILGGSIIGMFLKKGVPERFKTIVFQALGTATFLIGLSGVLSGVLKTNDSGGLDSQYILLLILSLVLGGVLGELLRLDRLFDQVGEKIKRAFSKQAAGTDVGTGFANCTILFCAGAMAIVGAVQDGLAGDPTMLIAKGMMDGIVSVLFTTVYGVGVTLSALAVLVYQGSITLLGQALPDRCGGAADVPGGQRSADAHRLQLVGDQKVQCGQFDPGGLPAVDLFPGKSLVGIMLPHKNYCTNRLFLIK